MTDRMENLVRPEYRAEWKEKAPTMFVMDESDVDQLREPGDIRIESIFPNRKFRIVEKRIRVNECIIYRVESEMLFYI